MSQIIYFFICIYVIILPLISEKFLIISKVSDLLLVSIIFLYLIKVLFNRKNRNNFIFNLSDFLKSFLGISMTILTLIMITSTIYATEKPLALSETFRFITYIALIFIIKYEIKEDNKIKNIINCFIFTTVILTLFGLIQYFTKLGLDVKFISDEGTRITSTMSNPNGLGAYIVLTIFPIFMLSFSKKEKKIDGKYFILAGIMLIDLLLTYSRNSLIGFGIGFIVLAIICSYKILYALLLFIPIFIFDKTIIYRFEDISRELTSGPRLKLWQIAGKMIKEHPILGVGNGNYVALYDEYVERYPEYAYQDYHRFSSHNSYLKIQSELGILGSISFISVIIATLNTIIKTYKTTKDKYYKVFYMGVMASTIAFLCMNCLDNLFFSPQTTTYFWLFIALGENILSKNKKTALN